MKPQLELVFELDGELDAAIVVGQTAQGLRRMVPIKGGSFRGAGLQGEGLRGSVLPGGADWQIVRPDGVAVLEALYLLQTDDGIRIQVHNHGMRHGPEAVMQRIAAGQSVDPGEYYFRATPVMSAPGGKYDWLNRSLFVCTGTRAALGLHLWFYRIT